MGRRERRLVRGTLLDATKRSSEFAAGPGAWPDAGRGGLPARRRELRRPARTVTAQDLRRSESRASRASTGDEIGGLVPHAGA